jgi:UDP-glucose 4-epimerase
VALLVTGGAGFFGGVLLARLLEQGYDCVSVDLVAHELEHPRLIAIKGDIRDEQLMKNLFAEHDFEAVLHTAAMLAHAVKDEDFLWTSNVTATEMLARLAVAFGVQKFVFISSNCLWGENFHRPVTEKDEPAPVEIYGRSKWEAERTLQRFEGDLEYVIIRCPTIIDSGRLGLLTILFDFIREGRRVWVVGSGTNRYQFIYAPDLADACLRSVRQPVSGVFNIGSNDVPTLREVYQYVIDKAGTAARIASLPKGPALAAMRLAHRAGVSPLGPYHYRMIAEDFIFDIAKIRATLGWEPSLTNGEMLYRAYDHYVCNFDEMQARAQASAHRQPAKMGAIRLLKWIS